MIVSRWQIDHVQPHGRTTRLLDYGDELADELPLPLEQTASDYSAIASRWGGASADGAARRTIVFTRYQFHADDDAVCRHVLLHPARMPLAKQGKLVISHDSGLVVEMRQAVVLSASPAVAPPAPFRTMTSYQITAGETVPVAGYTPEAGDPWEWLTTEWQDITTQWQNL